MREKKGDGGMNLVIVGGIIAAVVLVIVYFSIWGFGGKTIPFFQWLGLNRTVEVQEGIEILRYDLSSDKVQYYDGTQWLDFGKELRLRDKVLNYESVKKDFVEYYYKTKRDNNVVGLDMNLEGILDVLNYYNENTVGEDDLEYLKRFRDLGVLSMQPFKMYVAKDFFGQKSIYYNGVSFEFNEKQGSGDVEFVLVNQEGRGPGAGFFLSREGRFYMFYINSNKERISKLISYRGRVLDSVFDTMRNWTDSVLNVPMPISIGSSDKSFVGPIEPLYTCVQFKDNKYLVVDLQKSVKADEKCGALG